ncbi:hypothetical protein [Mesobacterium pallidum]|uniref:hypothetical protein n=1 Tax=Mesobacterium pallidum TaxID=2872037 RepID=UPI001EE2A3BA|nr:hypothetical protein [Mesobacterium pallidum]
MDISFRAAPGAQARVIERPGLWMDDAQLSGLAADLRTVAGKTLPAGQLTYGVFSGDRGRLERSVITLITRKSDGVPIAFNALALMDLDLGGRSETVLHLGLVMIDPDTQGGGLSWVLYGLTCTLMLFRNGLRPLWVSNVTQVPAVVGLVASGFANVFPAPTAGGRPEGRRHLMHLLLARRIMAHQRHVFGVGPEAGFDEDRFVITNAYTGGSDDLKKTFDDAPKHRDAAYNDFCRAELDYDRGDDVLQLGQIDLPTAVSYLAREVPPRSFAAAGLALGMAVMQRLALPLWHWSDSRRTFGILRARGAK